MHATSYVATSYQALTVLALYILACIGLSLIPKLFRAKEKVLYMVNVFVAFPVFDSYHRMAHLPGGAWGAGLLIVAVLAGLMSTYACVQVREAYVRREDCERYLRERGATITYGNESEETNEQDQ